MATSAAESDSVLAGSKLIYFGIPGRGEAVRLALAVAGIEFEDKRVPFPAWGRVKPTTPWGTLPVLELADGTQLAQARSVLRFVGTHTGLYPADPLAAQRVDELMDVLEDLGETITSTGQCLPKEEQEAARLAAVTEGGAVHALLTKIDAFIQAHGTGGHAVGAEMNIASILTFTCLGRVVGGVYYGVPPTVCEPFPQIQAVRRTVGNHPAVVAWYDARIEKQASLSPAEQVLVGCRGL
jgi:glutathione S-transferase